MIKTVEIINSSDESLLLELANPSASGFAVSSVSGLGPVTADITTTSFAGLDGANYSASKVQTRNITMTLVFNPTDVENMRHTLYNYFTVKSKVRVRVRTDTRYFYCDGYVESCDVEIFSKFEYAYISIICPDPTFYTGDTVKETLATVTGEFTFPFHRDNTKVFTEIIMGTVTLGTTKTFTYDGEMETGCIFNVKMLGRLTGLTITHLDTSKSISINTDPIETIIGRSITVGDILVINTKRGEKSIKIIANGVTYNVLNSIGSSSDWINLRHGSNRISVATTSGSSEVEMSIEAPMTYMGA